MTDCHSSFGGLLQQTNLASEQFAKSSDQMSSFSATTDQSSPPYSHAGTEQMQYATPESHYNDQRTETPSSDQLNIDNAGYSPDVATIVPGSDRDESPDTVSTSSGGGPDLHADTAEMKPILSTDDSELQRQILHLQGFQDAAGDKKAAAPLNLLSAFNSSLLKKQLSASLLAEKMAPKPTMPSVPLGATMPQTTDVTPTKRKRQRRNPVWPYFDVIDGTARCKQCLYSTKSVFSTNLKVHLRSHHRADYEKVIQAEDALNLNALLLSGNSSKLFSTDLTRKRMPPMTSSILMTINKLASQQNNQNGEENPLNSVLRQTLAAGNLNQQLQQVQSQMAQQQQQQQQQQKQQFPLNAANLAALNNMARNQLLAQNNSAAQPLSSMTPEQFISQFNFPNQMKNDLQSAPHGTDANGMPQPKRRRLRRHPVWMFFRDLEDRMVGCINCNFRTGSAFSTNLKMHLKAHHKEDYERVLKLEDDMRIEEGIFGPPNKMKSELIDFIRGGGNASTPPSNLNSAAPKATPLVQQIISQTMGGRPQQNAKPKENMEDDPFSGMSMSDKLAALVGLAPQSGTVEGEISEEKPAAQTPTNQQQQIIPNSFDELRRAAERIVAANMGLQPPPQEQTIVNLSGSIMQSENKSSSSASSSDLSEDKKQERDRALARFWLDQGGNDDILNSDLFKDLAYGEPNQADSDSECPILEKITSSDYDVDQPTTSPTSDSDAVASDPVTMPALFDLSSLTYDGLFEALSSFERSLGLSEATSCSVLVELLRNSAHTSAEQSLVETVAASLLNIAQTSAENNRSERMRRVISEKMKLKRLFETPEQRQQRLERMRQRYRSTKGETQAGRQTRDTSLARDGEEAKEHRLRRLREYQRKRLERETPQQRERRLSKMRDNQRQRRERQNAAKGSAVSRGRHHNYR